MRSFPVTLIVEMYKIVYVFLFSRVLKSLGAIFRIFKILAAFS